MKPLIICDGKGKQIPFSEQVKYDRRLMVKFQLVPGVTISGSRIAENLPAPNSGVGSNKRGDIQTGEMSGQGQWPLLLPAAPTRCYEMLSEVFWGQFSMNYRTLAKEGPWAVDLTLGQDWGMGGYSRYQCCI